MSRQTTTLATIYRQRVRNKNVIHVYQHRDQRPPPGYNQNLPHAASQ